jgi:cytochrome b
MARGPAGVRVWDLPTRVFHWLLAALVVFSWLTGQWGGSDWREWHYRSGYVLLALLLFRIAWGFIGPRYARFASFPPNPLAAWRGLAHRTIAPGHAAPGALSVYAMLVVTAAQVVTGLFATDGSYSEGPWARLVSHRTVDLMTGVHVLNRWLLGWTGAAARGSGGVPRGRAPRAAGRRDAPRQSRRLHRPRCRGRHPDPVAGDGCRGNRRGGDVLGRHLLTASGRAAVAGAVSGYFSR